MSKPEVRIIDRYVLLDPVAEGGTSTVYRAMQASTQGIGRLIVLKVFKPDYLGKSHLSQQGHRQQVQVMIGFNHPNIVQVYDIGEERAGIPYIAMEYIHGKSLRHLVICLAKARKVLNPEFIAHVGHQVARALHYVHSTMGPNGQKTVHRNISPQNILLSYDGEVKLIEFGMVTDQKDMTGSQLIRGRAGYTPPEELEGKPIDSRSDIFALGIVLWEALTGSSLFTSESRAATFDKILNCEKYVRVPSAVNRAVPKELDAVVMKALQKDPDKRFQSASEMEVALEKVLLLSFQDFSSTVFRDYLHQLFSADIAAEAEKIKKSLAEGEKAAKAIVPAGKNAFLRKFQGSGDDETEDTKIIMGKVAEGAVGSRNLDVDKDDLNAVEIEAHKKSSKNMQRGGYVKRIHSESSSGFGAATSAAEEQKGAAAGSRPASFKDSKQEKEAKTADEKATHYAWAIKIGIVAAIVFLVLPRFGIQLWSIPSLVEKLTALSNPSSSSGISRSTASDPTAPKRK